MTSRRWAAAEATRKIRSRFEAGWHVTPEADRRIWARGMLAAVLSSLALLFMMVFVLHAHTGTNHFAWEERALNAIASGPIGFASAVWLQTFGADFMLVAVVLVSASYFISHGRPLLAITMVLSLITMDAIVRIGWFAFARHRPEIIARGLAAPGFHSFPSGHTAKTFVIYGLLFAQWIIVSRSVVERVVAGLLFVMIAVVVPYGRLRMGAHWPTDIVGGYVIGAAWLLCALIALRKESARPW